MLRATWFWDSDGTASTCAGRFWLIGDAFGGRFFGVGATNGSVTVSKVFSFWVECAREFVYGLNCNKFGSLAKNGCKLQQNSTVCTSRTTKIYLFAAVKVLPEAASFFAGE